MKTLKEQLNTELNDFKIIYLKNIESYLNNEFERISLLTENDIINSRGYDCISAISKEPIKRHTKASHAYWAKISSIKYKGLPSYVSKGLLNAELNFENSINKVVEKCKKKNLNILYANVIYYGIGNDGNPRFDISDSLRTVYCYTIIAMGEVQQPHYRFLIK